VSETREPTTAAGATSASSLGIPGGEWDAFVESSPWAAYPQLSAWAEVKAPNGWSAERLLVGGGDDRIGAQVLVHVLGPLPWRVGYAPRGPVADRFDAANVAALTAALRDLGKRQRLSHVAIDPAVEHGHPLAGWLLEAGWRAAPSVQPERSRLIDLTRSEEELWSDLRSKWRQYVSKARRAGVVVTETGEDGLDEFYRVYVETARRAGFVHRAASAYREVYAAYAKRGAARLLVARLPDGSAGATIMLLHCSRTVIEPYGGMTEAGADARANYLLKWEAIRSSREAGFATYDMWGLAHRGIEQFKAGFGGREVRYIGGFELVLQPLVRAAVGVTQDVRVRLARRRHGVDAGQDAG
jgi:lipid II:glycine glycyltransferase (peptidoglycan interpeptide bridge formation enzyme)